MTHLTSRKFILAVLTLAATVFLCAAGHIHEGVYSAVVIATVGAYLAANVTQKATAKEGAS